MAATRSTPRASSAGRTASRGTRTGPTRWCTCCGRASSATASGGGRRGRRRVLHLRRAVGARGAGGRRPARARASARRPRRDPARQRADWVLAFWGAQLAGAVVVPVNTRFTDAEATTSSTTRAPRTCSRRGAARRRAGGRRGPRAGRPGRDLLHERHHRVPEGRDDLARELPGQHRERVPLRRASTASEGPALRDAGQRPAVPRHRLQQPAAGAPRARRPRRSSSPTRSTSRASCARVTEEGIQMLTSVPAIYHALTRHPEFADGRPRPRRAGSPTAARRSPPTRCTRSWRRSPRRGSATASASPRRLR